MSERLNSIPGMMKLDKLLRKFYGTVQEGKSYAIKIITQDGDEIKFKVRQFYREEKKVTYGSTSRDEDSSFTVSYYREETIEFFNFSYTTKRPLRVTFKPFRRMDGEIVFKGSEKELVRISPGSGVVEREVKVVGSQGSFSLLGLWLLAMLLNFLIVYGIHGTIIALSSFFSRSILFFL